MYRSFYFPSYFSQDCGRTSCMAHLCPFGRNVCFVKSGLPHCKIMTVMSLMHGSRFGFNYMIAHVSGIIPDNHNQRADISFKFVFWQFGRGQRLYGETEVLVAISRRFKYNFSYINCGPVLTPAVLLALQGRLPFSPGVPAGLFRVAYRKASPASREVASGGDCSGWHIGKPG